MSTFPMHKKIRLSYCSKRVWIWAVNFKQGVRNSDI